MEKSKDSVGCVIMASGEGRRFGANKLMAEFGGKPLIQWILDATDGIFRERIVVTRHKEIESLCRQQNIPTVLHTYPGRNDTVRLGLEIIRKISGACMFCAADQPFVQPQTLRKMINCSRQMPDQIIRLSCGEQEGNPVIFPKWTYEELLHLPEKKGGGIVIQNHRECVFRVQAMEEWEMLDIDTREEYEKYRLEFLPERLERYGNPADGRGAQM